MSAAKYLLGLFISLSLVASTDAGANNHQNSRRAINLDLGHTSNNFLHVSDQRSKRGGVSGVEGDGFAFVRRKCGRGGSPKNFCDIELKFDFSALLEPVLPSQPNGPFNSVVIHFFDNAGKTLADKYFLIDVQQTTGCQNTAPTFTDRNPSATNFAWQVELDISKCKTLSVMLSGEEMKKKVQGPKLRGKGSGRNVFYVVEARKAAGTSVQCMVLGTPFSAKYSRSCSTADPVIIVRKNGIGQQ